MKLNIQVSLPSLNRKIRQLCLLSTFCFLSFVSIGQNLVLNSGFDSIISCPPNASATPTLNLANYWYDPTGLSSDLYNSCNGSSSGVPSNSGGYQLARSGNGYGGFISYWENPVPLWSEAKEYLAGHLSESLIASRKYYLEFYVSLADNSKYGTSLIGAYLSPDSMEYDGSLFLPLTPQIKNDTGNIIIDKINWTKISGCFQASGGESHLTIGNFNSDTITENYITQVVGSGFSAYYYVEDVQLHQIPSFKSDSNHFICSGIVDSVFLDLSDTSEVTTYSWFPTNGLTSPTSPQTWAQPTVTTTYTLSQYTPCDTSTIDVTVYVDCDSIVSVESLNFPLSNFKLFPNPNTGEFNIVLENYNNAEIEIFNVLGELVYQSKLTNRTSTININNHPKGFYLVIVTSNNASLIKRMVKY